MPLRRCVVAFYRCPALALGNIRRVARVMIVLPSASYRTASFLSAAKTLRAEAVIATDAVHVDVGRIDEQTVRVDSSRPEWSAERIVDYARRWPLDAVVAADDQGVVMAALAARELGLAHNPPDSVRATRDKGVMRRLLAEAGVAQPDYRIIGAGDDPGVLCTDVGFPCVIKPVSLSASRGVIRVDELAHVEEVVARVRNIADEAGADPGDPLLVEAFVPGPEVALEGLLVDGKLEVLALFDKPDAMDGPYFEETLLITPSRLDASVRRRVEALVGAAVQGLGLVQGPVHAEARVGGGQVRLLEVAARSIGGLCGRSLRFGLLGTTLETTLLRSALGYRGEPPRRQAQSSGVMMLPISGSGTLTAVGGQDDALAVPGIVDLELTTPIGSQVKPPPDSDRYLGFMFATGQTPQAVEESLRQAHSKLTIDIH